MENRETEIRSELQRIKRRGNKKLIFGIAIILIVIAIIILYKPLFNTSLGTLKAEDVAFVSQADSGFQGRIKNITGYYWVSFLDADSSENAKITALLFLANEIDSLEGDFSFVNRSVGISKSELPARLNATDNSRENLLKLIGNVKSVENIFAEKGLNSAKIRANRLSVIEGFFKRYPLTEGEISPNAADIFAEKLGLTVDDYSRLLSLMIVNYNLFLAE